jgi:DNA-binding Lrp family transcriptional regulator
MSAGWTAIPTVLLDRQQALGLDAIDLNILMHLIKHWWFEENLPHPSKRSIAQSMHITVSTVRRRIAAMERDGLVKRKRRFDPRYGGQQTNMYEFSGLIQALTPYAEEILREREERIRAEAERRVRKRPLRIVDPAN